MNIYILDVNTSKATYAVAAFEYLTSNSGSPST